MGSVWEEPYSEFQKKKKRFLFFKTSRPALGSNQPPIQEVPCILPLSKSSQGMKLTTHPHVVPKLRMSGIKPPLPCVPSWSTKGQLYMSITYVGLIKLWFCSVDVKIHKLSSEEVHLFLARNTFSENVWFYSVRVRLFIYCTTLCQILKIHSTKTQMVWWA